MMKDAARITVTLPKGVHERLTAMAERSGVSVSWVVRYAVDELLRGRENGEQIALPLERENRRESR